MRGVAPLQEHPHEVPRGLRAVAGRHAARDAARARGPGADEEHLQAAVPEEVHDPPEHDEQDVGEQRAALEGA